MREDKVIMLARQTWAGTAIKRFCVQVFTGGMIVTLAFLCGCATIVTRDFFPQQKAKGTILFTGRVDDGGHRVDYVHACQIVDGREREISSMGLSFGPYLLPGQPREFSFTAPPGRATFCVRVFNDNSGVATVYDTTNGQGELRIWKRIWNRNGIPITVDVHEGLTTRVTLVLHDRTTVGGFHVNHFLVEVTDPTTGKMSTGRVVVDKTGTASVEDLPN